jgi:hypothetical protein
MNDVLTGEIKKTGGAAADVGPVLRAFAWSIPFKASAK